MARTKLSEMRRRKAEREKQEEVNSYFNQAILNLHTDEPASVTPEPEIIQVGSMDSDLADPGNLLMMDEPDVASVATEPPCVNHHRCLENLEMILKLLKKESNGLFIQFEIYKMIEEFEGKDAHKLHEPVSEMVAKLKKEKESR